MRDLFSQCTCVRTYARVCHAQKCEIALSWEDTFLTSAPHGLPTCAHTHRHGAAQGIMWMRSPSIILIHTKITSDCDSNHTGSYPPLH